MKSISIVTPTLGKSIQLLASIISALEKGFINFKLQLVLIIDIEEQKLSNKFLENIYKLRSISKDNKCFLFNEIFTNKPLSGPGFGRNLGIEFCECDYIHFCDDDDILYLDNYKFINKFKSEQDIILMEFLDSTKVMNNKMLFDNVDTFSKLNSKEFLSILEEKKFMPVQTQQFLFKKIFLHKKQIRFPNTHLIEDFIFNLISINSAKDFILINKAIYFYQNQLSSTKSLSTKERAYDYLIGLNFLIKNLSKKIKTNINYININQSISFLVFMLSIRLGGCDTNLVEAKDYILNKDLENIFTKKNIDDCSSWLTKKNTYLLRQIIEENRLNIDFYESLWESLGSALKDKNSEIFIVCYGPLGKSIYKKIKSIKEEVYVLDDRWKEILDQGNLESNAKIYPLSYLESLSLNKNYICVIANPNLIIENKIFIRISKIKELKKFTNPIKIIKAYSNLIGIST